MPKKPLVPKAGPQKRLDPQVEISGAGRFKPPGQFKWFNFSGTRHVPVGSSVKYTSKGTVGSQEVPKGSFADVRKEHK